MPRRRRFYHCGIGCSSNPDVHRRNLQHRLCRLSSATIVSSQAGDYRLTLRGKRLHAATTMDISFRPILSGLIGALLAHLLIRWLGRRFPIERKPRSLSWYEERYGWIEKACLAAFIAGISVAFVLYRTILSRNDPRGLAVGFLLGCLLAFTVLGTVTAFSGKHSFREYRDYQDLKYGYRSLWTLYLILPALAASIYGALHLFIKGV
jgi:hypothetical protein